MPQRYVGHPHGRRQQGLGGVHQVVYENIFLSCCTSFQPSFDRKLIKGLKEYVGHPHGCRQRGLGGAHQVVDENIFCCHIVHQFGLVFKGKSI